MTLNLLNIRLALVTWCICVNSLVENCTKLISMSRFVASFTHLFASYDYLSPRVMFFPSRTLADVVAFVEGGEELQGIVITLNDK